MPGKLAMYLAVRAVCDAKPAVWRRSEKFAAAYADFCACVQNLVRLRLAATFFKSVARGIAVESAVADTILTTEMDELIEQFEAVDVAFVDDYTAARSKETGDDHLPLAQPAALP
jgi:hypothetical protein